MRRRSKCSERSTMAARSSDNRTTRKTTFELQNYTTTVKGAHVWKFGVRLRGYLEDNVSPNDFNGTFIFSSIESYRQTRSGRAGAGPAQFSINAGQTGLTVHQEDLGAFVGDDWRVRSNITLSLGLRYETQTNIHDWRDFAPRLAVAWAPGGSAKTRAPRPCCALGFGIFYDRFSLANVHHGPPLQRIAATAVCHHCSRFFPGHSFSGRPASGAASRSTKSAPVCARPTLCNRRQRWSGNCRGTRRSRSLTPTPTGCINCSPTISMRRCREPACFRSAGRPGVPDAILRPVQPESVRGESSMPE